MNAVATCTREELGSVTGPQAHTVTVRLAKGDQHDLTDGY
jgi:hypothetical protein